MKRVLLAIVVSVFGAACAAPTDSSDGVIEAAQGSAGIGGNVFDEPGTFTDAKGHTWILKGLAEISTATVRDGLGVEPTSNESLEVRIMAMSLEEAADLLRPKLELGGAEYYLSDEGALDFAKRVRDRIISGEDFITDAGGMPEGAEVGVSQVDGNEGRKVISGYGTWYRTNSTAHQWPKSLIGTLDQGAGSCTVFKVVNQYTAGTAAHCVHSGSSWLSRQRIQFGAGSDNTGSSGTGNAQPYLHKNCYGRVVPGCYTGVGVCDYSVFYLRSGGAWCTENDYNVGWLGWDSVGSTETSVDVNSPSYPGSPPSGGYPSLFYQERGDGWASGSQLRYRNDTLGGSSGAGIYDDSQRLRAIHNDACGSGSCTYNYGMRTTSTMLTFFQDYGGS